MLIRPRVTGTLTMTKSSSFVSKGDPLDAWCLHTCPRPPPPYNRVRDLGITMADLQYTKFFFAGNNLQILGKVAITVQTIHEGFTSGNFPFKANVILGLKDCLEVDTWLILWQSYCTSSGAPIVFLYSYQIYYFCCFISVPGLSLTVSGII